MLEMSNRLETVRKRDNRLVALSQIGLTDIVFGAVLAGFTHFICGRSRGACMCVSVAQWDTITPGQKVYDFDHIEKWSTEQLRIDECADWAKIVSTI